MLRDVDLAAGDFVRWCKQLADLLGQIADAAGARGRMRRRGGAAAPGRVGRRVIDCSCSCGSERRSREFEPVRPRPRGPLVRRRGGRGGVVLPGGARLDGEHGRLALVGGVGRGGGLAEAASSSCSSCSFGIGSGWDFRRRHAALRPAASAVRQPSVGRRARRLEPRRGAPEVGLLEVVVDCARPGAQGVAPGAEALGDIGRRRRRRRRTSSSSVGRVRDGVRGRVDGRGGGRRERGRRGVRHGDVAHESRGSRKQARGKGKRRCFSEREILKSK